MSSFAPWLADRCQLRWGQLRKTHIQAHVVLLLQPRTFLPGVYLYRVVQVAGGLQEAQLHTRGPFTWLSG